MTNHIASMLDLLRGGLRVGQPRSGGGLTLVPLFGGVPADEYFLGAEAFGAGLLHITEKDGGQVPEILADNRADVPVLLLEGEHLEGARQDRVLNVSVLVAASRTTVIPVSCVEQGRWGYSGRPDFVPAEAPFAHPMLRERKARTAAMSARGGGRYRADQGAVWEEVRMTGDRLGAAPSATGRLGDYVRGRRGSLDAIVAAFPHPQEGQTGVVACIGGRPVAVDVFDRPEILAKVWTRLVGGYATDALGVQPRDVRREAVERFLREAAGGEATSHEGVGLGMQVLVTSPSVVMTALTWEGGIVHLAVLAAPGNERTDDRPMASPRARARRWFHGTEN